MTLFITFGRENKYLSPAIEAFNSMLVDMLAYANRPLVEQDLAMRMSHQPTDRDGNYKFGLNGRYFKAVTDTCILGFPKVFIISV
jgi:hypothetical protein